MIHGCQSVFTSVFGNEFDFGCDVEIEQLLLSINIRFESESLDLLSEFKRQILKEIPCFRNLPTTDAL